MGEKFEERMAAREEVAEKEEKVSLLDDLKTKKGEVAKAPKKDSPNKAGKDKVEAL